LSEDRISQYLSHMIEAASDATGFVEGLSHADFMLDKRT